MSIRSNIAENIRRYRKANNQTVTELANALDVAQSTISDWENGKKMPRLDQVEKICKNFHISEYELVLGVEGWMSEVIMADQKKRKTMKRIWNEIKNI